MHHYVRILQIRWHTVDVERFAGLNLRSFNPTEVFVEILSGYLGQKCLWFSIIKERCLHSWENLCGTLEICGKHESLVQWIFPCLCLQYCKYIGCEKQLCTTESMNYINPQILSNVLTALMCYSLEPSGLYISRLCGACINYYLYQWNDNSLITLLKEAIDQSYAQLQVILGAIISQQQLTPATYK